MWIATNRGFLSAVAADPARLPKRDRLRIGEQRPLTIRARNPQHLKDLFPGLPIYQWANRDYPARVFIGAADFALFLTGIVAELTYDNFKSSVADDELHDAYMGVWSVMNRYGRGGFKRRPYNPAAQRDLWNGTSMDDYMHEIDADKRPFNQQVPDDDDPCTSPGCSDLNPCMNCIVDALNRDGRYDRGGGPWGPSEEDRYGDFDSGDDCDDDSGAESCRRIAP